MSTFFEHEKLTKKETDQRIKKRANRVSEVARREAREGKTVTDENDLRFFKEE